MPWKQDGLILQVTQFYAHGPPSRRLEIRVDLGNRLDEDIVFLRSEVTVRLNNVEVAKGDLLHAHSAPAKGSVFASFADYVGTIDVPLSREALDWVERSRNGDVEYHINASALVAPFLSDPPGGSIGKPWIQHMQSRHSSSLRDRIPRSQWLEFLRSFGWDETVLFEVPAGDAAFRFPAAQKRWEEAVEHFRLGNWEETLGSCRKMFESLAAVKTDTSRDRPDLRSCATTSIKPTKGTRWTKH